jgi:D-alanyl-D-alanine carboxypeptidase
MFKRNNSSPLAALLIAVILLSLLTVYAASAEKEKPNISARSAALYQPDTNTFLYKKNADRRMHMASTTKIMTALVSLECASDLDELVAIPPEAVGVEGSSAYLRLGDSVTVRELLYALMLGSANDAAVALAYRFGGDIKGFADMMNERAAALGLTDTHFTNPHGLDDDDHYTTAEELALIAAEALRCERFLEICSTYKKTLVTGERERTYTNHNKLLRTYDGAIGVKTGFTDESGRCLVGAAEKDGVRLVCVTLDAPSDWADHKSLFDTGFEACERISLAEVYEYSYDIYSLQKGGTVRVTNTNELYKISLGEDFDIKEYVVLPRFISREFNKGDVLGYVDFYGGDEYLGRVELCATESVCETKKGLLQRIRDWLTG